MKKLSPWVRFFMTWAGMFMISESARRLKAMNDMLTRFRAFDTEYVSNDKRFEVDGANVARELVRKQGAKWDKHREQLLWDSIVLHTSPDIAASKEIEVALVSGGTFCELVGPEIAKQSWVSRSDSIPGSF
jgi:hypothetical protein